ncbi:MAG: malto-oligosyltrehalose synthase [Desulfomonile sp.]|nr:malto-oligosyltrehalose synthase [Desulfomonile sp.]
MRIPLSTYRIQFNPTFGFADVRGIVAYLSDLGISDLYASPIFKAVSGSLHGYDIVDPTRINPELGSAEDFEGLSDELTQHNMGWIQDIVPNHMAFDGDNTLLMDILENGPRSRFFEFFDVDWDHTYENIKERILAPFLGRFYGECLEDGEIRLAYGPDGLKVTYYETELSLRIDSYPNLFAHRLNVLRRDLGEEHPDFIKLLGVLYVVKNLAAEGDAGEAYGQITFVKRMLWDLYTRNHVFREFVDENIRIFNGQKGHPESFDLLNDLLSSQVFRLSYWKVATKEINYRRFFNINGLISLKIENKAVFAHTHNLILQLVKRGIVTGLRIDHVDGLSLPEEYLKCLRARAPDVYLVVEKILQPEEELPRSWPVQGTTGYDFANEVNSLLCYSRHERSFSRLYGSFTGFQGSFPELAAQKRRLIIEEHMAGDVDNLAQMLKRISSKDRHASDITLYGLRRSLRELLAVFPVYRTYTSSSTVSAQDRLYIRQAADLAHMNNPALIHELTFLKRFLLLDFPPYVSDDEQGEWIQFVKRFQQLTGPLMAKGFEDTTLYVYNRLISLNEVGGSPARFGCTVNSFHNFMIRRSTTWPHTLNTTSTHDTKRGEDVRALINVLSELPTEWERAIREWSKLNKVHKKRVRGVEVPDRNDEYFLYQTLVGAYPFTETELPLFRDRMKKYIVKAVREAKVHTEWIRPDTAYEDAYLSFVEMLLTPSPTNSFLPAFLTFRRTIARYGMYNALSQALIKIAAPGVPDFYQGSELWDLSLVDPDNRRPVDFEKRRAYLIDIMERSSDDLFSLIGELLETWQDGRIKLFLVHHGLKARQESPDLFQQGTYIPLGCSGTFKGHILAFGRARAETYVIAVVPRFLTDLVGSNQHPLGEDVWRDTSVIVPKGWPAIWQDRFTGRFIRGTGVLPAAKIFAHFPAGLLESRSGQP